jgi:hypothetical protein
MKKTIITVFAFLVILGFAVSGAMAQTWTWSDPITIKASGDITVTELAVDPISEKVYGVRDKVFGELSLTLTTTASASIYTGTQPPTAPIVEAVSGPLSVFYIITANDVFLWTAASGYDTVSPQPVVPAAGGSFSQLAAGKNGKIYVLYDVNAEQYLLIGNPPVTAIAADVKITPQSLNLGSNGNWVTCRIGLSADYSVADIELGSVCITAIDGVDLTTPICRASGSPSSVGRTLMVKFSRGELADAITAVSPGASSVIITVTGSGGDGEGAFVFTGDDTIKTKPAKTKKHK